jgi:hypothetical protein
VALCGVTGGGRGGVYESRVEEGSALVLRPHRQCPRLEASRVEEGSALIALARRAHPLRLRYACVTYEVCMRSV